MAELQLQAADAPMLQASCCSNAVLTLPTPQPLAGYSSIVNDAESQQPSAAESNSDSAVLGCVMQGFWTPAQRINSV